MIKVFVESDLSKELPTSFRIDAIVDFSYPLRSTGCTACSKWVGHRLYSFVISKSQETEIHYEQIMCLHNSSAIKPISYYWQIITSQNWSAVCDTNWWNKEKNCF